MRIPCLPAIAGILLSGTATVPGAETTENTTDPKVIALWSFDAPVETRDASGNGHDLALRGDSRVVEGGRTGGCLESHAAGPEDDRAQGALARNHPALSPSGAFTLEAWVRAKPSMDEQRIAFVLDKKYYHYPKDTPQANHDYCLYLEGVGRERRKLVASLGYGRDSAWFGSRAFDLPAGEWRQVAFTYDGKGTGRFFLDGEPAGKSVAPGRGDISPGPYGLAVGDRFGSTHQGFPGWLDEVRITRGIAPGLEAGLEVELGGGRAAFRRMEKDACVSLSVTNGSAATLREGNGVVTLAGVETTIAWPDLRAGETHVVALPVDTSLRPDAYPLRVVATARADDGGKAMRVEREMQVHIVARPAPGRMPVVMWGTGDPDLVERIGFTHQLVHVEDYGRVWSGNYGASSTAFGRSAEHARMLDEYLVRYLGAVVYLYPGSWISRNEDLLERFRRVDRSGKPYEKSDNICARFPEVQDFAFRVGASVAREFGEFPALQASLVHSEIRDGTRLCFHEHDRDAFRKATGRDIPTEATGTRGVRYGSLPAFPEDRVVPDDHPLLVFYRWFWKEGDAWNDLHTQVHRGLHSGSRDDIWTFFDPAVRAPSLWGSGGGVDVISQWSYSYPDPLKVGQAADELFAMAAGRPGQQVMKMTQIIWYRSQTAPDLPEDEAARAPWEREIPDARFITISPDHLREAFWCMISRPVRGIMYHGWGSLVDAGPGGYRYTNPETREVLEELIGAVVRPLGPTLLEIPDGEADVALLESFASQVFAGRGTFGWGQSWEADAHLVLQWARLQPRIIYDETVLRDGLDGFRVLVLPGCDVLAASVAKAILEFQGCGGIVVADESLAPAIRPDVLLPEYRRTKGPDEDKAALQRRAAELRRELGEAVSRRVDSSSPDVVVRRRAYGAADYVFAINDTRTFGDYVGHHGLVMEKGLPVSATLSVRRDAGQVYDLVRHEAVPSRVADGQVTFEADLAPGSGRVYLVVDRPITSVLLDAPVGARRGDRVHLTVRIVDEGKQPVAAVVPVEVEIVDARGRRSEGSGFHAAKDGLLSIAFDLAPNDASGEWTVRATELASGKSAQRTIAVE